MRYTRNRQLNKAYKTNEYTGDKNYPFGEWLERHPDLDPTFKWHREYDSYGIMPWRYNFIEFKGKLRLVKF